MAAAFFVFGYAMQAGLINPFITRPEHSQFMLLVAVAIIMVNALLMIFGPDARNVQVDYQLESFEIGAHPDRQGAPLRGPRGDRRRGGVVRLLQIHPDRQSDPRLRRQLSRRQGRRPEREEATTRSPSASARPASRWPAARWCCSSTSRRRSAPYYTLLAFVIVIVGGLGSMTGALLGGVLIGVSEALAGLFIAPSAKSMFSFGLLILVLLLAAAGAARKAAHEREAGIGARGARRRCWSRFPPFAGTYALSVATLILYFAYTGQAWNVMMGFAGQLSLGHSLYVGVGAYAAGALFFHYGIGPWAGLWLAIAAVRGARPGDRLPRLPLRHLRACTSRC